jgi:hypothetical protein
MAAGIRQEAGRLLTGDECQWPAHIDSQKGGILGGIRNQFEEAMFLLASAATEADQLERTGADAMRDGIEGEVVCGLAAGITAGGRAGLVESEPGLGLFAAFVVKYVVDAAGLEGGVQFGSQALR